jgi:hypothetical protein
MHAGVSMHRIEISILELIPGLLSMIAFGQMAFFVEK